MFFFDASKSSSDKFSLALGTFLGTSKTSRNFLEVGSDVFYPYVFAQDAGTRHLAVKCGHQKIPQIALCGGRQHYLTGGLNGSAAHTHITPRFHARPPTNAVNTRMRARIKHRRCVSIRNCHTYGGAEDVNVHANYCGPQASAVHTGVRTRSNKPRCVSIKNSKR